MKTDCAKFADNLQMALDRFSGLCEDFRTYRPAGLEQLAGTFNLVRFVSLRKVRYGWFCIVIK